MVLVAGSEAEAYYKLKTSDNFRMTRIESSRFEISIIEVELLIMVEVASLVRLIKQPVK